MNLVKSPVLFDELNHTYTLDGKELSGVTALLSRQPFSDKYSGIPEDVLAKAAEYGSNVHERIELSDTFGGSDDDAIVATYRRLKEQHGLTTLANEYLVSDNDYIASSIDIVFEGYDLCDAKTTSRLDEEYLMWQLSIYAYLFELQNPGKKAGKLYALWIPKPQYGSPALKEVPRIDAETVKALIEADKRGEKFIPPPTLTTTQSLTIKEQVISEVVRLDRELKALEAKKAELQAGLLTLMKGAGIKTWKCEQLSLSVKAASTRISIDSALLKEKYPKVYQECVKISPVKESLIIKVL